MNEIQTTAPESTSSIIRTMTKKLTEERVQHRQEVSELRAALATAHGQLLALRRHHNDVEVDS